MSLSSKISLSIAFFAILCGVVDQASAACPTVTPMANFNPTRFIGTWYAIRRFSTIYNGFATSCIAMNSTVSNRNIYNLHLHNVFNQRRPILILGTLASTGVYNLKFQVGLSKWNFIQFKLLSYCQCLYSQLWDKIHHRGHWLHKLCSYVFLWNVAFCGICSSRLGFQSIQNFERDLSHNCCQRVESQKLELAKLCGCQSKWMRLNQMESKIFQCLKFINFGSQK